MLHEAHITTMERRGSMWLPLPFWMDMTMGESYHLQSAICAQLTLCSSLVLPSVTPGQRVRTSRISLVTIANAI